ncbi:MAG: FtsW/RodA/SpoVE family cell cycle protein [Armatimonadetes bacterium]|nr:FtsW/RodA/SpoVE family cell cycle protein [Armatimonadota bacterium]
MQQQTQIDPRVERAHWIVFIAMCLIAAGIVWVESASYPEASVPVGAVDAFKVFKRQALMAGGAAVVLFGTAWLTGEGSLTTLGYVGFIGSLIAMVAAALYGQEHQGTRAWCFGVQPSEFCKVFLLLLGARLLSRARANTIFQANVLWYVAAVGATVLALVLQRDLGMLVLVGLSTMALLFVAGVRGLDLFALSAVGTAGVAAFLLHNPNRLARITAWLWPMDHLEGAGYHVMSSLIAVARGRGWGLLPGGSPDKCYALPYPATDSIFCVIAAESGLWGTALLLFAFGALVVLGVMAAHSARSEQDRLVALGCTFLLAIQAAIHTGVAVNLMPATGLTLPFISAGGSSLLASALAAGAVASVARRGRLETLQQEYA